MAVNNKFIIRKIVTSEQFFVLYSRVTRRPFAICDTETYDDQVNIYDSEERVKEAAKPFLQNGYVVYAVSYPKDKMRQFFAEAHAFGFNQVVFYDEGGRSCIDINEILPKPDFSKLPPQKQPLLNPSLQLSSLYFMQELGRQVPQEKKENVQELEEELAANLSKARLMLPVVIKGREKPHAGMKLEPGNFEIAYVRNKDGKAYIPVFSDVVEFQLFNKEKKFQGILTSIDKVSQLVKGDFQGVVYNPASMGLQLTPKMIDGILKRFFEFE